MSSPTESPSNTVENTQLSAPPSAKVSSPLSTATKRVHFDALYPEDHATQCDKCHDRRQQDRRQQTQRKRKPFTPSEIYGFYLPDDVVFEIGCQSASKDVVDDVLKSPRGRMAVGDLGTWNSTRYCQEQLPEVPFGYRRTYFGSVPAMEGRLTPIVIMGYRNSQDERVIELEEYAGLIKKKLKLEGQEAEWYEVKYKEIS